MLLASTPEALFLLLATAAGGLLLDAVIGDPAWLWGRLPHPVVWIGRLVAVLERRMNHLERPEGERRLQGAVAVLVVVGAAGLAGWALVAVAETWRFGWLAELVLVALLIAQRDLFDHVRAVGRALEAEGLEAGRAAVARIVGRDPQTLDRHGVLRAAIESLAENFSDGVVAPLFWYLALGPAGLCGYKAVNTLDSMIGHRTVRFEAFGMVAARLDDVANLLPARLSGLILALASCFVPAANPLRALRTMARDAAKHRSPNAGWPEAATAGALDLALAGPRRYHGELVQGEWIGDGRARVEPSDLRRALMLFVVACVLIEAGLIGAVAVLLA